jgi:lipoate-protein ligase A
LTATPHSAVSSPSPPAADADVAPTARLLLDLPAAGDWNMAADEVLLDWAAAAGQLAWRFYYWSEPTLSLGYFQPFEQRSGHAASRLCPVVRRLTGGGTILHDREVTYSVVVPSRHALAARRDLLYETVHACLIRALSRWGVAATMCPPTTAGADAEFLCFQRRSPGDVLVGGMKIAGSAQRRRRGAVLQHGSVILGRSAAAPEVPGLAETTGVELSSAELTDAWLPILAGQLGVTWRPLPLTDTERRRAAELVATRYATAAWTQRRGTEQGL